MIDVNKIYQGDCIEVMKTWPANFVDTIITDPPYGLEFMGKDWDSFAPERTQFHGERADTRKNIGTDNSKPSSRHHVSYKMGHDTFRRCTLCKKREFSGTPCKCAEPIWAYEQPEGTPTRMAAFEKFNESWAREAFRVVKPGAFMLVFGGTRTFHRMTAGLEDAGWEIRDCLMWLYGSGFPKSLDISKAIDKAKGAEREVVGRGVGYSPGRKPVRHTGTNEGVGRNDEERLVTAPATDLAREWSGWGTALKPAWEPIIVAMKPLDGTFAENAEKWGVAGINVDGGRIGTEEKLVRPQISRDDNTAYGKGLGVGTQVEPLGRWPANLILDEEAAAMLDGQSGISSTAYAPMGKRNTEPDGKGMFSMHGEGRHSFGDTGGASRFFYVAKASRSERNEGCEGLPTVECQTGCGGAMPVDDQGKERDRFKKQAQNHHPTVKPLKLMEYLCTLTKTPTGGIVLDPFAGSGSTLIAAERTGRPWIGIEMNAEYVAIANARTARERNQMKMAI